MRVYTGHQVDDPRGAFFVFARTRQEAIDFLASEDVEVDEHSLRPVADPGAVLFRTRSDGLPGEPEAVRFDGDLPEWER